MALNRTFWTPIGPWPDPNTLLASLQLIVAMNGSFLEVYSGVPSFPLVQLRFPATNLAPVRCLIAAHLKNCVAAIRKRP